jgi:hypothetical protein
MTQSRSIDLHNCTVPEAIRAFVHFYNACVSSGYHGRIEIIHGYGSSGVGGAIKQKLRKYLADHADKFGAFLAGDSVGNPGVTILYPRESLATAPQGSDSMPLLNPAQEAIRRFCATPKARERILIKLCGRFGDRVLSAEIRNMVQSGALEAISADNGAVLYRALK